LLWRQERAWCLTVCLNDQPYRVYRYGAVRANDGFLKDLPDDLMAEPTTPSGHHEAFHDAFARLHRCFEDDVRKYLDGKPFSCDGSKYANIEDGRMGIHFTSKAVESSDQGGAWVSL
jgi:hypothetical protein